MQPTIPAVPAMPWPRLLAVLVGFPVVSTLVSLLLLRRDWAAALGVDFFTAFWGLIAVWYAVQILLLGRVLRGAGWEWRDIGFGLDRRRTLWMVGGYLVVACALVAFIELALREAGLSTDKLAGLSDLANLTPKTTSQRVAYVVMGLLAGLCEELVYRGFAIRGLASRGIPPWLAIPLAAIPFVFQHGLKSIEQAWWFGGWAIVFGILFVLLRKLYVNIAIHWLVILAALPAILQALQ